MKVQDITTWATVPPTGIGGSFWVIVKVTTDDGIEGIGECYGIPFSGDVACRMVEDTFERYIAGEDPHDVETLFRRVYSAGFTQRPDISMMGVFSGIEIAVWDILGKASGQPVYKLIGGKFHERIRTYTYLYPKSVSRDGDPGENAGDLILETIQTDFHDAILKKPLRWEEGYLLAPTEPGLGIELDERAIGDHPYITGGRLHLEMCQTPLGSNNRKTITALAR